MKYSLDTSTFLNAFIRVYPPDVFPKLWEKINTLIHDGHLKATEMVLEELKRKDDDAYKWVKERPLLFENVDENIQKTVSTIMRKYPRIIAEGGQKNAADPFVIAFAIQHKLIVVTEEKKGSGSNKKPSIPFLCKAFDVECINLLDLIRLEEWTF